MSVDFVGELLSKIDINKAALEFRYCGLPRTWGSPVNGFFTNVCGNGLFGLWITFSHVMLFVWKQDVDENTACVLGFWANLSQMQAKLCFCDRRSVTVTDTRRCHRQKRASKCETHKTTHHMNPARDQRRLTNMHFFICQSQVDFARNLQIQSSRHKLSFPCILYSLWTYNTWAVTLELLSVTLCLSPFLSQSQLHVFP